MKRVFLIHGYKGNPKNHWFPWVMEELEKKEIPAKALTTPSPASPDITEWVKTMQEEIENPDEETYLVGHSLGVIACLRYIETLAENEKIGGVVLVSGFYGEDKLDTGVIKEKVGKIVSIHAKDDDVVPFESGKKLAEKLEGKLIALRDGGHFTTKDGKFEFPEVRDEFLTMME